MHNKIILSCSSDGSLMSLYVPDWKWCQTLTHIHHEYDLSHSSAVWIGQKIIVHGGGWSISLKGFQKKKKNTASCTGLCRPFLSPATIGGPGEREPVTPRQKEAPLFWMLCPCCWMSLGWVSFAREQAEEDGRFWFLWILGWLGFA